MSSSKLTSAMAVGLFSLSLTSGCVVFSLGLGPALAAKKRTYHRRLLNSDYRTLAHEAIKIISEREEHKIEPGLLSLKLLVNKKRLNPKRPDTPSDINHVINELRDKRILGVTGKTRSPLLTPGAMFANHERLIEELWPDE